MGQVLQLKEVRGGTSCCRCALRSFTWNGPLLVLQMRSYKMLMLLLPLWYYLCVLQLVHCY